MKLENQCCTLEQAIELRKLGVKQDSLFYHFPIRIYQAKESKLPDYNVLYGKDTIGKETHSVRKLALRGVPFQSIYSAFTVAELSIMLGSWSFKYKNKTKWIATIITKDVHKDGRTVTTDGSFDRYDKTQAQALATLLIAIIKVGQVKVSTVNGRLK
jgi:hypothetical protein